MGNASQSLILGLCLVFGAFAACAQADDTPYTISKLVVDVTAKNAVAAKTNALAEAGKVGLNRVLRRVVPFSFYSKLPDLQQEQIEGLVNDLTIRKEQYSTTRYMATLDISFNESGVKQFIASLGLPLSEERAPMISILPVVIEGNQVKSGGNDGWRQAWLDLDLAHGLTPANVLQARPGLEAGTVRAVLAGDASAFASLQGDYGSAPLVIAVGQAVDGDQFITRLAGTDGVGRINYGRSDKLNGGAAPKTSAKDAAAFAYAVLEDRWKATRAPLEPIEPGRYEKEMPPQGAPQGETGRLVTAVVEFAGLKQWQDILARLTHVPGIRTLDVNSLSARTASITFGYAGSLGRLQKVLADSGFSFENGEENFVLRAR
ncbi:MAG TPA: DUF2066 domain-containing protein [Methyloceanibacter sp.]|nr:DUF2066 domain-containing protein [Methyloceanibacter sp.]